VGTQKKLNDIQQIAVLLSQCVHHLNSRLA
jgi:hypothetical protein